MTRRAACSALLAIAVTCACAAAANPQSDALAVQQAASGRLKTLTDAYRRTLDVEPLKSALASLDEELTKSNLALRAMRDHAGLAAGLIKQGDVWRLLDQQPRAAALYADAGAAALRARDARLQALAASAKARVEFSAGNTDQAERDARRALQPALASGNQEALARAYGTLLLVQLQRKDLAAAEASSEQQFAAAAQGDDGIDLYLAHFYRSRIHSAHFDACDYAVDPKPCTPLLDAQSADLAAAQRIALRMDYPALAKAPGDLLVSLVVLRMRISAPPR